LTTRVHSARRSTREPASIPARTSGREQPSGPGPGSARFPNRGVAHAPIGSWDCERRSNGPHKAPSSGTRRPFTGSGWPRDGSDHGTSLMLAGVFRGLVVTHAPLFDANHRVLSRLPSRRQPFQSGSWDHCEKTAEKSSSSLLRSRAGFFAAYKRITALTRGANSLSAWRERPRPWPQAWQTKRPFRVVAHATDCHWRPHGQGRHQAGGTERRPTTTACNLRDDCSCRWALTTRE
jgi:hypothetical protein